MRGATLLLAAVVLIAPSCPRDYGPSDYAPDASWKYGAYEAGADLVYVAGASAKGDSVYVIAMPGGDIVARIDGPDRRGWAFAGELAYYPVMRSGGPTTVHRLNMRTGERARLIVDERPGAQVLGLEGPVFTSLATSEDGRELFVARALREGPRVWLGRYDAVTGALKGERTWPIAPGPTSTSLARVGDVYSLSVHGYDAQTRPVGQQMHILDGALAELATPLPAAGVTGHEVCAADLARMAGGRWATLCGWRGSRYATAVFLDSGFRVASHATLPLGPSERVIAWAAGEDVTAFTERATHIRVTVDGDVRHSMFGDRGGAVRVARPIESGTVHAQWMLSLETGVLPELVRVDLVTGRVLGRSIVPETVHDFALAGDRLYALMSGPGGGPRVQRLDPVTLLPVGTGIPVPQRDDIGVHGITVAIRGTS